MLDVCWTSRPNWAWESQLGLAVRLQDAGVSGAGILGCVHHEFKYSYSLNVQLYVF